MFNEVLDFCTYIYYHDLCTYESEVMKMSPRTGRPTEDPRTERLEIRLTKTERDSLEELATKLKLNLRDTLSKALELLGKTEDYFETGQLLDAIVIKSIILKKLRGEKPDFLTDEEWNDRLQSYEEKLKKSDGQIMSNANMIADLLSSRK